MMCTHTFAISSCNMLSSCSWAVVYMCECAANKLGDCHVTIHTCTCRCRCRCTHQNSRQCRWVPSLVWRHQELWSLRHVEVQRVETPPQLMPGSGTSSHIELCLKIQECMWACVCVCVCSDMHVCDSANSLCTCAVWEKCHLRSPTNKIRTILNSWEAICSRGTWEHPTLNKAHLRELLRRPLPTVYIARALNFKTWGCASIRNVPHRWGAVLPPPVWALLTCNTTKVARIYTTVIMKSSRIWKIKLVSLRESWAEASSNVLK